YSFTASEGDNPNRFLLHFGAVGLDENTGENSIKAYSYNNILYIQNSLEDANIRVIDLQGRLLLEKQLSRQGLQSLPLDFPAGVYVVQLLNSKAQKSVKVIVE
ncbi:MAG: T9SS type A sorting domain-containing protein, partial [Bacteroidetes bacterium]|nr:T9SS type A sorting domain-containing protein [Bacteroidota bacterium]MBU1578778.1 T9SS type A sorting domain-containing protein [Bacteroidota bacterium]